MGTGVPGPLQVMEALSRLVPPAAPVKQEPCTHCQTCLQWWVFACQIAAQKHGKLQSYITATVCICVQGSGEPS